MDEPVEGVGKYPALVAAEDADAAVVDDRPIAVAPGPVPHHQAVYHCRATLLSQLKCRLVADVEEVVEECRPCSEHLVVLTEGEMVQKTKVSERIGTFTSDEGRACGLEQLFQAPRSLGIADEVFPPSH